MAAFMVKFVISPVSILLRRNREELVFLKNVVFISLLCISQLVAAKASQECFNKTKALSTFVSACAGWKAVHQQSRNDAYQKQKDDCRKISKEFSSLIYGVANKICDFVYDPNLTGAIMKDEDVKSFDNSL